MTDICFLHRPFRSFQDISVDDGSDGVKHYFSKYLLQISRFLLNCSFPITLQDVDDANATQTAKIVLVDDNKGFLREILEMLRPFPAIGGVLLCEDQKTLSILLGKIDPPDILTLDFYFQHSCTTNNTYDLENTALVYKEAKRVWPRTKVIGLSHFYGNPHARTLSDLMLANGDIVLDKSDIATELPKLIYDVI